MKKQGHNVGTTPRKRMPKKANTNEQSKMRSFDDDITIKVSSPKKKEELADDEIQIKVSQPDAKIFHRKAKQSMDTKTDDMD